MTGIRRREVKSNGMNIRKAISSSLALALFGGACLGLMPGGALNVKAETIEIGVDSGESYNYFPSYELYNYSITQTIYTADEMGYAGGTISGVSFYRTDDNEGPRSVKFYLMDTDKVSFTSDTDWPDLSGATLCYEGSPEYEMETWSQVVFTNQFEHDSSSNLLLFVADETGNWRSSTYFKAYSTADGQAMVKYTDASPYDLSALNGYEGTIKNIKLSAIFEYTPYAIIVELPDDTAWLDPIRDQIAMGIGTAAATNAPATVYFEGDFSLPYEIMKKLQNNPNVTLVYNMLYKDTTYKIVIPGSEAVADPEIPWYGPEYLIGKYLAQ